MAIKHVKETLGQFQDWKYFSVLEEKSESKDEKKFKDEEQKDGMDSIKKLRDNLSRFETAAGGKIIKYKEFWEENQEVAGGFDEEGNIYKMWDSDYVAGVLVLPDEALTDDALNAEIEMVDQAGGDEDEDEETTDEETEDEETEEEDEETEEDEEEEDEEEDEEELEEGNAFGKAVKNAKKKGKKDFKVGGKKYPVKESWRPEGEEFALFEAEEEEKPEEEEAPAEEEEGGDEFQGFNPDSLDMEGGEETDDTASGEEVEVEDGEAVELDGDLDGDGDLEGGLEFAEEGGSKEYFVIFDMSGSERDEVFRTDDPKVIEEFKNFFENEWKAAVKNQIQQFKQAQEEKKREAEEKAREEIRKERKGKLEKFMKESLSIKKLYEYDVIKDPDDHFDFLNTDNIEKWPKPFSEIPESILREMYEDKNGGFEVRCLKDKNLKYAPILAIWLRNSERSKEFWVIGLNINKDLINVSILKGDDLYIKGPARNRLKGYIEKIAESLGNKKLTGFDI